MNENDLIAEYIKERYPEILQTMDFAVFKLAACCRRLANEFIKTLTDVDFEELQLMANEFNERNKKQEDKQ